MTDVQDLPPPGNLVLRDPSRDYHQLNAGANRRQATNVRAPALTWHRAFWLRPPHKDGVIQGEQDLENDRLRRKASIDAIILAVWAFLHKRSCDPASGLKVPECHPRVRRSAQPNSQGDMDVHLLFGRAVTPEQSGDHLCFKSMDELRRREEEILNSDNRVVSLKYSWQGLAMTIRTELHSEYFVLTVYVEFPDNKDEILSKELRERHNAIAEYFKTSDRAAAASLNRFFFHGFWRSNFLSEFLTDRYLGTKLDDEIFHDVFADFRGLVICDENWKVRIEKVGNSEELDWSTQIDKQCLQLFTDNDKYECTANYLLDGRGAYFSTLAPQTPEAADRQLIPLEYVLYVHRKYQLPPTYDGHLGASGGVNRWQLGRLVDRIHLLGTMRLASLKYLPALRRAGATLSHLASYVNVAREAIDPENAAQTDASGAISKVHSTFGRITTDFDKATETNTGILYRIEQSRYYKEQFDKNMKALRIGRIEGYQRYDQFIERRLGPAFDFIDRLGRRYERATNNIATLDQNYLTMKIASIDSETNRIDSGIRKIQEWGEFVLLAALVPYYVNHLLVLIIEQKHEALLGTLIMIWAVMFALAIYRMFHKGELAVMVVAAALLFVLGLQYPVFSGFWEGSSEQPAIQAEFLKTQKSLLDRQSDLDSKLTEQIKIQSQLFEALRSERQRNEGPPPEIPE
jgi:hypothetical protein